MRHRVGLLGLVLLAAGCGGGGATPLERSYKVTGTVRFKGQPIPDGIVRFTGLEGNKGAAAAPIQDGNFRLEATAGPKRVEVIASGPWGRVPPEYGGEQSPLKADVAANDSNRFEFDIPAR